MTLSGIHLDHRLLHYIHFSFMYLWLKVVWFEEVGVASGQLALASEQQQTPTGYHQHDQQKYQLKPPARNTTVQHHQIGWSPAKIPA